MAKTMSMIQLIDANFSDVSRAVVTQLKRDNAAYRDRWERLLTLTEQYPALVELFNGDDAVHLTADEHRAMKDYMNAKGLCEADEKTAYYFKGHADAYDYFIHIGVIDR